MSAGNPDPRRVAAYLSQVSHTPSGCHLWTGGADGDGYGLFHLDGRQRRASHLALEWFGPGPRGLPSHEALHSCDTPACVNPDHLRWGSSKENSADCTARQRQARGERNGGGRKLSEGDVIAIRVMMAEGGSPTRVGRNFGVSDRMVAKIASGQAWKHVGGPVS